jgi:anti-sigma factor RsiW
MRYTCHHCHKDLYAYTRGELRARNRRLIAQHLEVCSACYAEYRRLRAFDGEFAGILARLGMPDNLRLAQVWGDVQSRIAQPYPARPAFRLRYGAVLVLLMVSLLLPWLLHHRQMMSIPLPPTPALLAQAVTHAAEVAAKATGYPDPAREMAADHQPATPGFAPNSAPSVSATETP